jgi:hypothetical protein
MLSGTNVADDQNCRCIRFGAGVVDGAAYFAVQVFHRFSFQSLVPSLSWSKRARGVIQFPKSLKNGLVQLPRFPAGNHHEPPRLLS